MSAPNQLSFLPDDYLARKARRRALVIFGALFAICCGGVVTAIVMADKGTKQLADENASIGQRYDDAAKRIKQVQDMQDKQRKMAWQAELTASLLEKVPRTYLLADLTNALPAGVGLFDFTLESRITNAAPTAAAAGTMYEQKKAEMDARKVAEATAAAGGLTPRRYDVFLKLTGIAYTDVQVAQYLTRLSRSKLLRDVNLVVSEEFTHGTSKVRKFQIEAMLNNDADVRAALPGDAKAAAASVELAK